LEGQRSNPTRRGGTRKKDVEEEEWGVGCVKGGERERAVKMNNEIIARGHLISASNVTLERISSLLTSLRLLTGSDGNIYASYHGGTCTPN
jgi:hypothetical protein